ncbi:hypothetical protein AQ490_17190 [Wenjunlia vitaminophila]|uniref:Thioredoxin-like fold domain-containing protein n=1 Tax=Wenjunlia vitaminophila TaxID=76728 RepID=A0A0T6LVR4_WENVI|nr:thioredoxin domain-containing protein [Wenjunlia vitaminophila]KRV50141.1 hypothetical protein AQ490_17190 [Wenjunlia vitaminophila]
MRKRNTKNTPTADTSNGKGGGDSRNPRRNGPGGTVGAGKPGSARARLAEQRAREDRRRRVRRQVTVAGSALLVVALATGIGAALSRSGGGGGDDAAAKGPLRVPSAASGTNGTVITYGDPKAENTLEIYEDPRCPYCALFEQTNGETVRHLADQGRFKVEYHFASFLDDRLGGKGSTSALNALGAAADRGPEAFADYHQVLFENHPDERSDDYASADHLLELADEVDGLRTPAFDRAVRDGVYLPWVKKVSDAFEKSGVNSTPTIRLNGEDLNVIKDSDSAISPQEFTALVDKQLK